MLYTVIPVQSYAGGSGFFSNARGPFEVLMLHGVKCAEVIHVVLEGNASLGEMCSHQPGKVAL